MLRVIPARCYSYGSSQNRCSRSSKSTLEHGEKVASAKKGYVETLDESRADFNAHVLHRLKLDLQRLVPLVLLRRATGRAALALFALLDVDAEGRRVLKGKTGFICTTVDEPRDRHVSIRPVDDHRQRWLQG